MINVYLGAYSPSSVAFFSQTAEIFDSNSNFFYTLHNADAGSTVLSSTTADIFRVNVPNSFIIREWTSNAFLTNKLTSIPWSVKLVNAQDAKYTITSTIQKIQHLNNYDTLITFTPFYQLPVADNKVDLVVTISRGSVPATTSSTQVRTITIKPGPISLFKLSPNPNTNNPTISAGSVMSFSLSATDAFQNVNNSNAINPTLQLTGPDSIGITLSASRVTNGWEFTSVTDQIKKAGQWTASGSASVGGVLVESNPPVNFVVNAGPAASATIVEPNPADSKKEALIRVAAGIPITFIVTLRDAYENLLNDATASAISFNPQLLIDNTPVTITITRTYSGLSSWAFSLTATRVAKYSLNLGLAQSIKVTPANAQIIVENGNLDVTKTQSTIGLSYVAGTALSFNITLFDAFMNPFLSPDLNAFQASYQTKVYEQDSVDLQSDYSLPSPASIADQGNGVYAISIDLNSTKQAGDYLFSIAYFGNILSIDSKLTKASVIAADVSVPHTLYPSLIPNGNAGVPFSFDVILRDQFSNPILNKKDYSWKQFPFSSHATCEVTDGEIDSLYEPTPLFVYTPDAFDESAFTQVWMPTTSSYRITVTPQQTGPWTIIPQPCPTPSSCDRMTMFCTALIRLKTRITPGPADASQSFVYWTPNTDSITAGQYLSLVVVLRDKFRNWIEGAAPKVVIGDFTGISLVSPLPSDIDPKFFVKGLPYNPNDQTSDIVRDNKNSTMFIRAQPTVVGRWAVLVAVGNSLIGCVKNASDPQSRDPLSSFGLNKDCTLSVIASDPFSWKLVDRDSVNNIPLPNKGNGLKPIASVPFTIFLQVSDFYRNPITQSANYSYSIVGKNEALTAYSFDGVLKCPTGSPICSWTFVSFWDGPSDISIRLLPGPHPICVARSPQGDPSQFKASPYRCLDGTCQDSIDRCETRPLTDSVTVDIQHVTCAALDSSKPFRCPDRSCVASPNDCKEFPSFCPDGQVRCAVDNSCKGNAFDCPCPSDMIRSISGACIIKGSSDIPSPSCPTGTLSCPYVSVCRKDLSDCPTPPTCPPGYFACPDTTCALTASNCSDYASKPSLWGGECKLGYRCLDGSCQSSLDNCPTRKTCPTTPIKQVLCPDGSCQDSAAKCPEVYSCANPLYPSTTQFRCSDGSCKDKPDSCPSQTTCPLTMVLCDNGQCALSRDKCLSPLNCPPSLVRCPDGTCSNNLFLCPSKKTCPSNKPVLCPDGSCNTINTLCTAPRFCPSGSRVCADGSCAVNDVPCPTTTTCRADEPVLCSDGTCVTSRDLCRDIQVCPPQTPFRCPDGSCRVNLLDCPSRAACNNPRAPIRCMDGHCVASADRCPSATLLACPIGQYRCPGGECTTALALCPTQVTCPLGGQRCNDGSCRLSCTNAVAPECDDSAPVRCPTPVGGLVCVSKISQCPQFQVCPINLPVRCMDATCASSVSDCPALPETGTISLVPCPDGSWSQSAASCPTPVSCPVGYFKCFDNTCRKTSEDCPQATACPKKGQFRCPNGACADKPWESSCITNTASCVAFPGRPVRCPGDYTKCDVKDPNCYCKADISECVDIDKALQQCPAPDSSLVRCRDGSCRPKADCIKYTSMTCPAALPYLCDIGLCVSSKDKCPSTNNNGVNCPPDKPENCLDGTCVQNARESGSCKTNPKCDNQYLCSDGSCAPSPPECKICKFRCYDGTCADYESSKPTVNACISGAPLLPDNLIPNACPASYPIKCSNGLCADTYLNCTSTSPSSSECKGETPFECANGKCVVSSEQCPPILPVCPTKLPHRCNDGQCVLSPNICSFIRRNPSCPTGRALCPKTNLCSPTSSVSDCIDPSTGCATGYKQVKDTICKDVIGLGEQSTLCIPDSIKVLSDCSPYAKTSSKGCPSSAPEKCWDGACVTSKLLCRSENGCPPDKRYLCEKDKSCAIDATGCPLTPPSLPFTCANGTRVERLINCQSANGCPITAPVRCADGDCKKYPSMTYIPEGIPSSDVCPSAVGCPDPLQMCYDNTCVPDLKLCAAAKTCPANTPYRCIDGSCVAGGLMNCKTTNNGGAQCPPKTPVICSNGLCAQSLTGCPNSPAIGTSTGTADGSTIVNGGSGSVNSINNGGSTGSGSGSTNKTKPAEAGDVDPSPPISKCTGVIDNPVLCFDGSCAANYASCLKRAGEVNGQPSSTNELSESSMQRLCGNNGDIACADGQCVPKAFVSSMCGIIPACSSTTPIRCNDGSCAATKDVCEQRKRPLCEFSGYRPSQRERCEDGSCRLSCLPYDGCPVWLPYQCNSRECAASLEFCEAAKIGQKWTYEIGEKGVPPMKVSTSPSRRLLSMSMAEAHALGDAPRFASFAVDDNNPSNTGTVSGNTATTACYYNCRSQVKAGGSFVIDTSRDNELVIAEANGVEQSWLYIPAGALRSSSSGSSFATIIVSPVSDSRVRAAENRVIINRRSEFGGSYLTMVRSLVSPAFDIQFGANVSLPLSVNLTLRSSIDTNAAVNDADRCLAKLLELYPDSIGYAAWQCKGNAVHPDGKPSHVYEQSINDAGVYAIIIAPVKNPEPASELSWAARNAVYIALALIGLLIIILAVLYFMKRLHRYRAKLHQERAVMQKQVEEVEEMEQFGGGAGQKDDEVEMMSNPMVLQMKDMQRMLDIKDNEMRQAELAQRQQESAVRHEHIHQLKSDRDNLQQELERLRSQLQQQQRAPQRPVAVDVPRPAPIAYTNNNINNTATTGYNTNGGVYGDTAFNASPMPGAMPEQGARTEFQARGPKKARAID